MREIKFKVWDEGNKIMHTNVMFVKSGDDGNDWLCLSSNQEQYKVNGNQIIFDNPYFRQQIHLLQFTGLKDKNGKEIYEGDIIQYDGVLFQVVFIPGEIGMKRIASEQRKPTYRLHKVQGEIIGNTYEHPELLIKTVEQ